MSSDSTSSSDSQIDLFMTIFINIGNILSIIYNIPQMWRTYKLKKADDISSYFLWMRLASGIIWSIYCIYYKMWYVIISWASSIVSTIQILYYKYYPVYSQPELITDLNEVPETDNQPHIHSHEHMILN
jgi:uncharacterized protein with PQ loop repeat